MSRRGEPPAAAPVVLVVLIECGEAMAAPSDDGRWLDVALRAMMTVLQRLGDRPEHLPDGSVPVGVAVMGYRERPFDLIGAANIRLRPVQDFGQVNVSIPPGGTSIGVHEAFEVAGALLRQARADGLPDGAPRLVIHITAQDAPPAEVEALRQLVEGAEAGGPAPTVAQVVLSPATDVEGSVGEASRPDGEGAEDGDGADDAESAEDGEGADDGEAPHESAAGASVSPSPLDNHWAVVASPLPATVADQLRRAGSVALPAGTPLALAARSAGALRATLNLIDAVILAGRGSAGPGTVEPGPADSSAGERPVDAPADAEPGALAVVEPGAPAAADPDAEPAPGLAAVPGLPTPDDGATPVTAPTGPADVGAVSPADRAADSAAETPPLEPSSATARFAPAPRDPPSAHDAASPPSAAIPLPAPGAWPDLPPPPSPSPTSPEVPASAPTPASAASDYLWEGRPGEDFGPISPPPAGSRPGAGAPGRRVSSEPWPGRPDGAGTGATARLPRRDRPMARRRRRWLIPVLGLLGLIAVTASGLVLWWGQTPERTLEVAAPASPAPSPAAASTVTAPAASPVAASPVAASPPPRVVQTVGPAPSPVAAPPTPARSPTTRPSPAVVVTPPSIVGVPKPGTLSPTPIRAGVTPIPTGPIPTRPVPTVGPPSLTNRVWTERTFYQAGEDAELCYEAPAGEAIQISIIGPDGVSRLVLDGPFTLGRQCRAVRVERQGLHVVSMVVTDANRREIARQSYAFWVGS